MAALRFSARSTTEVQQAAYCAGTTRRTVDMVAENLLVKTVAYLI